MPGPSLAFDLKINGVNAQTEYGLYVSELRGQWDGPIRRLEEVPIPGRPGAVETSGEEILDPLDFVIVAVLDQANQSDFEDALDALKYALSSATLTLISGNQETRERTGKWTRSPLRPYVDMKAGTVEIGVRCLDPLAYETTPTTVSGSAGSDLACELGTYKVWPVITVTGASFPLTVTYKDSAGNPVESFTIAGSGTTVIVDCANLTVTIDGDRDDNALTAGDFFALDPRDGDRDAADWPTVRTSSGSISIVYRKAWS